MTEYIGAHDPREAERLALQESEALGELRAALAAHVPPPGVRVLELGCGTGIYTRALLDALPGASVIGIDRDPTLLAHARGRLAGEIATERVTLLEGDGQTTVAEPGPLPIVPPPLPTIPDRPAGPAPRWDPAATGGPRPPRRGGPMRILVTALAAVLLLVAIIGGGLYLTNQGKSSTGGSGTPTATATSQATATATATTQPTGSPTATVGRGTPIPPGPPPTTINFCNQPLAISDEATCTPKPPSTIPAGTSAKVSDPAPTCDSSGNGASWARASSTNTSCVGADGVAIQPPTGALGCLFAQSANATSGYASMLVKPGSSGSPVLGILQNQVSSGNVEGYYLKIVGGTSPQYVFYNVDGQGNTKTIGTSAISNSLAAHYVIGVSFGQGNFTLYINGNSIGTASDTTYTSGWLSICGQSGPVDVKDVLLYPGS